MNSTIIVEYDRDGTRVYAWEEDEHASFIRDFDTESDLDKVLSGMILVHTGRWDGETSTKLCPAYEGRACTTGGRNEHYVKTDS